MPLDRYGVLGRPVAHSLSPVLQKAAFRSVGLEAEYERIEVAPAHLADTVACLRVNGYRGFNVTMPHKARVIQSLDDVTPDARRLDAVNTVVREGDRFIGHNTDIRGFDDSLTSLAGTSWEGRCLLFGGGGAARAVAVALRERGCRTIAVVRDPGRARGLVELLGRHDEIARFGQPRVVEEIAKADLIVNATPLGMADDPEGSPLPPRTELNSKTLVFDLIYGRVTPLLERARDAHCKYMDGLEMLVRQGAVAFFLWTGIEPDVSAMRNACIAALEGVNA